MTADTLTTALERSAQPKEARTVLDLIDRTKPQLAKLLGSAEYAERFARVATTEGRRTPKLWECDPYSFVGAMMLSAQYELEPGPLGLVYFVPVKGLVEFWIGYKGRIALAYRSGLVKRLETGLVREGDAFEWRKGSRPVLDHTPSGTPGERDWTHVWALAELTTGGKVFEVLFPEDVEKRRQRSAAASHPSSPWNTDTEAMWRKSAVRALAPYLPQVPATARVLAADEAPVDPADVQEALDGSLTGSNDEREA